MRSRSTYLLLALVLVMVVGLFWQRQRRTAQRGQLQERSATLAVSDTATIDRITIQQGTTTTELLRQGSQWTVASAGNAAADSSLVTRLLENMQRLRVLSVAAVQATDFSSLAVGTEPSAELTLQTGQTTVRRLKFQRITDSYAGAAYVLPVGETTIYLAEPVPFDLAARTDWRDKAILRVPTDDIQEIKYQRGRVKFTLAKNNGAWQLDGKPANQDAANLFATNLANLNATDLLSTNTVFKPIGITIGLTLKDKQLELTLGEAPRKDEAYLKTSDGKLFWLANTNRTRLTKERKEFVP